MLNLADRRARPPRLDVRADDGLVERPRRRLEVHLAGQPLVGKIANRDGRPDWIDVGTGDLG